MSPENFADKMMKKIGLEGVLQISDPDKKIYQEFQLKRGTLRQLFGPRMWIRGFQAGIMEGLWVGRERGDGFQMPGYFVIHQGKVIESYIPKDAADHPDFLEMASCAI